MPVLAAAPSAPFPLLYPPVLFFFLGAAASLVKSNLRVPRAVTRLLSLYLLWSIGFRGGVEIAASTFGREEVVSLGLAVLLAVIVPLYAFFVLRLRFDIHNAAAVAATYGSVSAVTFMTATQAAEAAGMKHGGHMVAAMAFMESPAIVVGVLLLRLSEQKQRRAQAVASASGETHRIGWGTLMHEAFLNGPVILLLGSLAIGLVTGEPGYRLFKPLCTDLFNGVLVFFLLDLGLVAARRLRTLREAGVFAIAFAILAPMFNATLATVLARLAGLQPGNAFLLIVLAASASYIAVPAAARIAIPKANPSIYLPMSLAVTFPIIITAGIPLAMAIVHWLW